MVLHRENENVSFILMCFLPRMAGTLYWAPILHRIVAHGSQCVSVHMHWYLHMQCYQFDLRSEVHVGVTCSSLLNHGVLRLLVLAAQLWGQKYFDGSWQVPREARTAKPSLLTGANVYLASAELAAVAAILGRLPTKEQAVERRNMHAIVSSSLGGAPSAGHKSIC